MIVGHSEEHSDRDLVEAARSGHVAAFGTIVERYQQLVCAVAYSSCGNITLSEDVAQETFVAAWTTLEKLESPDKLKSWLCSIASNKARDALRKRKREVSETEADLASRASKSASPEEAALASEREQSVWMALQRVPETYRDVLVLFYREGQSLKQVSAGLGLSIAAVKQRLSRGREALRGSMAPVGGFLAESRVGKVFTVTVIAAIAAKTGTAAAAGASAAAARASSAAKGAAGGAAAGGIAASKWIALAGALAIAIAGIYFTVIRRSAQDALDSRAAARDKKRPTLFAVSSGRRGDRVSSSGDLSLRGRVVDLLERPVVGAIVTVSGTPPRVASTDARGEFAILGLAARTYGVDAHTAHGSSVPIAVQVAAETEPVVLTIETGSTLEVRVVDERRQPIQGATVALTTGLHEREKTTSADGLVEFTGITATGTMIRASAPGFALRQNHMLASGEPVVHRRLFVLLRGRAVSGVVRDERGGPISGAEVTAMSGGLTTTDESGAWQLDAVAPGKTPVWITHDDYVDAEVEILVDEIREVDRVETVLGRGRVVSGEVLDAGGTPVPYADVIASAEPFLIKRIVADEHGRFTMSGLPARVRLVGERNGLNSAAEEVSLPATGAGRVSLRLGDHCIRGRALTRGGDPSVGARVQSMPVSFTEIMPLSGPIMDLTDSRGAFALCPLLPGESYRIAGLSRGVSQAYFEQPTFGETVAEAGTSDLTITIAGAGQVAGRLVGDVPDEFAVALASSRMDLGLAATLPFQGTGGDLAVDKIPAGTYSVAVTAAGYRASMQNDVVVPPDGVADLGDIRLEPGVRYSGVVVDGRGRPVAGARVAVDTVVHGNSVRLGRRQREVEIGGDPLGLTEFGAATARTDVEGRFAVVETNAWVGNRTLIADHVSVGRSRPMLVSEDGASALRVALEPGGILVGRVRTTEPVIVIAVLGDGDSSPRGDRPQHVLTARTDPDGSFRFDRVAAGTYQLSAGTPMIEGRLSATPVRAVVVSGATTQVQIDEVLDELPPLTTEQLTRLEELTTEMCECRDRACATPIIEEVGKLSDSAGEPPASLRERYDRGETRFEKCVDRLTR